MRVPPAEQVILLTKISVNMTILFYFFIYIIETLKQLC